VLAATSHRSHTRAAGCGPRAGHGEPGELDSADSDAHRRLGVGTVTLRDRTQTSA
jgi:hypothetical protein